MRRILALTFATLLLATPALRAQESTTRGFNWGLHFGAATLTVEDGDRNDAGGGGIWLGYGFNRTVQLFVQLDGAQFDVEDSEVQGDWTMGHGDLGVRFHFANSLRSWVPYLQAAVTGRVVGVDNPRINGSSEPDAALIGGGLTLGAGMLVYFTETLAMDIQLDWTGGTFTQLEYGNVTVKDLDLDATSTRFNLGLNWWP